jgi:hypothetical protein
MIRRAIGAAVLLAPTLGCAAAAPPEARSFVALAERDLSVRAPAFETVDGRFVLVAAPGLDAGRLHAAADLARRAIASWYARGRFARRPRPVGAYLYPSLEAYGAYCVARWGEACRSSFGFFHAEPRLLLVNTAPGLGTLLHEMVHPILDEDFPDAPAWLAEGLASVFEAPRFDTAGDVHGDRNERDDRLLAALQSVTEAGEVRLEALFGMTDARFREREGEELRYAMARSALRWLDSQGKMWPFYEALRDGVGADATGESAFRSVMGVAPRAAAPAWIAWIRAGH